MNKNLFSCSIGEKDSDYLEDNFERIIKKNGFVIHKETKQKGSYDQVKEGDILLLKYVDKFIAYGEVTTTEITNDDYWNHWFYVDTWHFHNFNNKRNGVGIYGLQEHTLPGNGQMATIKSLSQGFGLGKVKEIDPNTPVYQKLLQQLHNNLQNHQMKNYLNLLEYKKQIILQGPPGTGKTRLAEILARELTKASKTGSPIEKIDNFFKNFEVDENVLENRHTINTLQNEFLTKFRAENLKDLTLDDYVLGTEEKDGFCYWLEYKLDQTGKYAGQSDKGKIYWKSEDQQYVKSGFVAGVADDEEAMNKVAAVINNIVNEQWQDVNFPIGKGFVLKLLNTYHPEKYFPINNDKCLKNALKLFNEDSSGLNYIEKNLKLQEIFENKKKEFGTDVTNYEFMYFLFGQYNLKGEVKFENEEVVVEGSFKFIQFHPSYSYEDFVRGITAEAKGGQVYYKIKDRILMQMASEAIENKKTNYVLIIDEINRANLPSVLGELILALEYRYKHSDSNSLAGQVESLYDIGSDDLTPDRTLRLPENLYIIATMNTADRSVGHIDYAIRRRFAFVEVLPKKLENGDLEGATFEADSFRKVSELFIKNYEDYLQNPDTPLEPSEYLSDEMRPEDVWLGHSYFINKNNFDMRLKYEIKPILKEYINDGILKPKAITVVNSL